LKIVVAFNAFKGSLSPVQAGYHFIKGWSARRVEDEIVHFPIADGGDGTLEVWKYHFGGQIEYIDAHDPLMRHVKVPVLIYQDKAMFAMADVSGIALIHGEERNAKRTTTYGMGEVIATLIKRGIKDITISVGGSATVDGGVGLLLPLGVKIYTDGYEIKPEGQLLLHVKDVDISRDLGLKITVVSDVNNPLTGQLGAASVYGPQKGLSEKDIPIFDEALYRWGGLVENKTGASVLNKPMYGAAGGVAVALHLLGDVKIVSGIEFLLSKTGFSEKVKGAQVLFTGEGKIDRQTFMGKAPYGAAKLFKEVTRGKVIGIGGKVEHEEIDWSIFDSAFTLVCGPVSVNYAMKHADKLMRNIGFSLAGMF